MGTEEKEPFKIKFTTVLIIVICLLLIIGILAFNLRRLEDTLATITNSSEDGNVNLGMAAGVAELNDYEYFSENYQSALNAILNQNSDEDIENELSFKTQNASLYAFTNDTIGTIELDSLGDVYCNISTDSSLYQKYGKTTKILSDIIDFQIVYSEGYVSGIYFLHRNGTVSSLDLLETETKGEIVISKLDSLSGIIKVIDIPSPISNPVTSIHGFVDINGNIFNSDGEAFE